MPLVKKCRHGRGIAKAARTKAWKQCRCTWYADLYDDAGKRRYTALGGEYRAARIEYDRLAKSVRSDDTRSGLPSTAFAAVAERLIASKASLRPATIKGYKNALVHANAYLGTMNVSKITSATIAEMDGALLSSGMSFGYARNVRTITTMVLGHAADAGLIPSVPRARRRRAAHRNEQTFFTPAELAAIWAAPVPTHDSIGRPRRYAADYLSLFQWAALTGMRAGELLALQPEHIDRDRRICSVRLALDSTTRKIGQPKTPAAIRDIDISDDIIRLLPAAGAGERYWPTSYVRTLTAWHVRLEAAGFPPCGTHALRHSNVAVRLTVLGQDLPYVADQIGHAGGEVTLREYAHLIPRPRADADGLSVMLHGEPRARWEQGSSR